MSIAGAVKKHTPRTMRYHKRKLTSMKHLISVVLISAILVSLAFVEGQNKQFEISKNLEIFTNIYRELNSNYVDDIDPARIMRTGIEAMLETLDPYTNYISEADIESYRYMAEGKYDGIGARVRKMGEYVTIVEPYEDGPALAAGLKAGDQIIAVEGKDAKGKKTDEVNDILKGFPGTSVTITIRRPGESKDRDVTVERNEVSVKNVPYSGMLNDEVGYVVLTTFTANAGRNVAEAIKELLADNPSIKGLVFDLRDNGGGYLREAVSISNLFIPKDEVVVTTKGKVKDRDRSYRTMNQPLLPDLPLVILTNKWTASASEIVSGVVQDLDRGLVLGQKTYGKGLVQNTVDLDYNAKLKLTTAKYYIPSGRCIQSVSYKDGEPVDVSEDQKAVFKTRAGRKVLDGGGIMPDIAIGAQNKAAILQFLADNNLIFHYATHYHQTHPDIGDVKSFQFTDFDDFIEFVQNKNLDFQTTTEKELDELMAAAEDDKLADLLEEQVTEMRSQIEKEKEDDLTEYREDIIKLLENEIVSRYYFQTGKIQKSLENDEEIQKAIEILTDRVTYASYLQAQ